MQQKFELDLNFFEFQFYRKWSIKRRGAYFIFPVRRERRLFQLRLKHWGEVPVERIEWGAYLVCPHSFV